MTESSLKILHVVRQFEPSKGGLETYVRELASRQAATDDVTILTLNRIFFGGPERLPAFEQGDKYRIVRVPFVGNRHLFFPFVRPALLRGYDVIHIHAADQLLDVIAGLSLFMPLRLFMTTHGMYFHTDSLARIKRAYLRTITKFSLGRTRGVFAVSTNDAQILASAGIGSVTLLNPVVTLGDFICDGKDLLYVGRLSANKRVDALVAFMAEAVRRQPTLILHIVGTDNENLSPGLAELVASQGLEKNVIFHGFLETDALVEVAKTCGFIISASSYEGFGISIIEGMSVGLLPVMHDNAAFRETFERSGCGLLTDFDDPAQAARDFAAWRGTITRTEQERAARFARAQGWDAVVDVYFRFYGRNPCSTKAMTQITMD
ncbi:MAG: glycosyltransferase family 4 protein [Alphaproteobacteria bacterium]